MGKFKEMAIEQGELLEQTEQEAAAQQEAYYHYCIAEFYGMLKVFGTKKVMEDLQKFKETVELPEDKPRIITL